MAACDVCNKSITWADGYVLTTDQVATTEAYWELAFAHVCSFAHDMDPEGRSVVMLAAMAAGQSRGWLVCESCSKLFTFDRQTAKDYAHRQSDNPPGAGPAADPKSVALAAAAAWKKLYGALPSSLQIEGGEIPGEETTKACDFCGRRLGSTDPVVWFDDSRLAKFASVRRLRPSGAPSARGPRGKLGWVACRHCTGVGQRPRKWWQFWK